MHLVDRGCDDQTAQRAVQPFRQPDVRVMKLHDREEQRFVEDHFPGARAEQ